MFFPLCMLAYFLAKSVGTKNTVLILFSLVFYAWGEPVYVFLMIGTIFADYLFGLAIERTRTGKYGKLVLALGVAVNLASLVLFKYAGFLIDIVNGIFGTKFAAAGLSMPIGISFYTFQALSYLVDVYRADVKAQHQPHKLLLYVSMFPQLIAGPIVRYQQIANEIDCRTTTPIDVSMGIDRVIVGLAKKVIFANAVGQMASTYLDQQDLTKVPALAAWFALTMYALQIYFDFSAYSDMAIGMGRMLGFHFLENFNYPYLSASITEFWRRWHMSLGTFFRDYVYIPLGGNRCSKGRHIFNMFIVWFLTGLWHGASWNYVLWGLYFFVFLVLEKYVYGKFLEKHGIFAHIYFLILVVFGWSLFYYRDMSRLGTLMGSLFGAHGVGIHDTLFWEYFRSNGLMVIVACIGATPVLQLLKKLYVYVCSIGRVTQPDGTVAYTTRVPATIAYIVKGVALAALLLICTSLLVGQTFNPFIYFNF